MVFNLNFDSTEKYFLRRPEVWFTLHGPGGAHRTTWSVRSIIDTGADFLHLPTAAAKAIGIDLSKAQVKYIYTAAGGKTAFKSTKVNIELYGQLSTVTALFGENQKPLFGRVAIFKTFKRVAFDTRDWHYRALGAMRAHSVQSTGRSGIGKGHTTSPYKTVDGICHLVSEAERTLALLREMKRVCPDNPNVDLWLSTCGSDSQASVEDALERGADPNITMEQLYRQVFNSPK